MPAFLLLLTGFAGLVYEVVWARWFATVYGGTTPAAAAVLAAYLGGLALGAAVLGRRVDRSGAPWRFFGFLQFGVGLLGLLSLAVPSVLPRLYGALASPGASAASVGLVRFALAALFLGLPAILMGASLPAGVKWHMIGRERGASRAAGQLRAAGCIGAALGALAAAYYFVPMAGLNGTVLIAGGLEEEDEE